MFEYIEKKLLKIKNPCRKCLVKVVCRESTNCDMYAEYVLLEKKLRRINDWFSEKFVCSLFISFCILIGGIFCLGLFQLYQILSIPVKLWLF